MTIVRVEIRGRVQGVWFRAWTAETARAKGLRGWVRNRRDGSVEALFAGPVEAIEEMIAACHKGSRMARVKSVERFDASAEDLSPDNLSPEDSSDASFVQLPTT